MKKIMTLVTSAALLAATLLLLVKPAAMVHGATGQDIDSTATINVAASNPTAPNPEDGQLLLKTVPDFSFGTLASREIFNGVQQQRTQKAGQLTIVDNRLGTDQWQLSVKVGAFTRADQQRLAPATLQLLATNNETTIQGTIPTDDAAHVLTGNQTGQHGLLTYDFAPAQNNLSLGATPQISLSKTDTFSAPLTWTLAPSSPTVPTL